MTIYYFGCLDEPGHYLYGPELRSIRRSENKLFPFDWRILDGRLLPQDQGWKQGIANLIYINEWTIITFWDNTIDSRPASNAAFIADQNLSFSRMIEESKKAFPQLFARFKFEITQSISSQ